MTHDPSMQVTIPGMDGLGNARKREHDKFSTGIACDDQASMQTAGWTESSGQWSLVEPLPGLNRV